MGLKLKLIGITNQKDGGSLICRAWRYHDSVGLPSLRGNALHMDRNHLSIDSKYCPRADSWTELNFRFPTAQRQNQKSLPYLPYPIQSPHT